MRTLVLSVFLALLTVLTAGCQFVPTATQAEPTAYIDSISPPDPTAADAIAFQGHGTDSDGSVVAYRWRSSIDGDLGTSASFSSTLSVGSHTIYFRVQDNNGNWSDEVTRTVVVVVVSEGGEGAPPEDAEDEMPAINSFSASPESIVAGDSSTLAWDVSGATTVAIDHGVGTVDNSGTTIVTPETSTEYTLTAASTAGIVTAGALVLVSTSSPGPDEPDLVVTSITRDGSTVKYTVANQGTADAGPCNSRLFVDGDEKASDAVAALAAGASRTESFSYAYECSGTSDALLVQIDKDELVDESDETNNSHAATWFCMIVGPLKPGVINPGVINPDLINPDLVIDPSLLAPDLTVTSIWESSGRIFYTVENIGTKASEPSTSKLVVNGSPAGTDSVPSIAAGASLDKKFSHNFNCLFPTPMVVEVRVDAEGTNSETNEGNNSLTAPLVCH